MSSSRATGGGTPRRQAQVEKILPGAYRITLPIPGRKPGPINVYLFTGSPVTMVDTGFLKTVEMLRAALGSLGVSFSDIEQIIITHGHVDHYGGAAVIRREAGRSVKVYAHREDAPNIEQRPAVPERIARRFYRMSGLPLRYRLMMMLLRRGFKSMAEGCEVDAYLEDGEKVRLGAYRGKVLSTPGHSKGGICLHLEEQNILLSGDHVLGHVTPNAFVMLEPDSPLPRRRSQDEFYASLDRIMALRPSVVYTGHMDPVKDLAGVSAMYRESFAERQRMILSILGRRTMTPYRIARKLFPSLKGRNFMLDLYLSISEVYTHLQVLEREGRVKADSRFGIWRFARTG